MNTNLKPLVQAELKGMGAFKGAPVVLQNETVAALAVVARKLDALGAQHDDKLDRYKGAVLAEFMDLCNYVTRLEVRIGKYSTEQAALRTELFALKTRGCDE